MSRSNEVWFVQAYDPNDGNCKSFATGWEAETAVGEAFSQLGRGPQLRGARQVWAPGRHQG